MEKRQKFKCDLCAFSCQFKQILFRHKNRAHFEEVNFKFKCDKCRVGFSNKYAYVQHINIIHQDNGSRFKCIVNIKYKNQEGGNDQDQCGITFQLRDSAKRHLKLKHKIDTKNFEEAKKYFKIVMTNDNQFRRSKFSSYYGRNNLSYLNSSNSQNKNNAIKEEVVAVEVDDPDEILKILENNDTTDDLESNNVPCSSENICIIEEKFIPDIITPVLPIDDIIKLNNYDINPEPDQTPAGQKFNRKNKKAKKKKIRIYLPKTTKTSPLRASLSRSCKNSTEILQSSQELNSESSETEFEPDSESEVELELKIKLKVKIPKNVNKNFSKGSPVSCHICRKKFARQDHLKYHLVSSLHPENRVECKKCPKSHFVVKGTLKKHHEDIYRRKRKKNMPKSQPKLENSPCTEDTEPLPKFDSESTLKSKSPKKVKITASISCHICGNKFTRKDSLKDHLISKWHPENRVECTKCPKSHFVIKGSLKKHHEDILYGRKRMKNFPKSKFKSKPKLTDTSKPEEKVFSCAKCHKLFDTKNKFKCHDRYCNSTTTGKDFNCKECNLFFKALENLNRHFKFSSRHAPNSGKRFFCTKCSSGFTKGADLTKHFKTKHENDRTRFDCTICCTSYGRYDTLLAHLKKEEHKLREQDFQKKNQNQDNTIEIKKEKLT